MKERTTVLLVDDDPSTLHVLPTHLSELAAVDVVSARDGREAIELMRHLRVRLVVTRLELAGVDGLAVLAAARQRDPRMNVVVLTSLGPAEGSERLVRLGGVHLLRTPCPSSAVAAAVRDALDHAEQGRTTGVHLPAVARLIEHVGRSCTVDVVTPEHRGRLHFVAGRLVDAAVDGGARGEAAAVEVFGWSEVRFAFGRAEPGVPEEIRAPLEDVLLAAALIDEDARPRPETREAPSTRTDASADAADPEPRPAAAVAAEAPGPKGPAPTRSAPAPAARPRAAADSPRPRPVADSPRRPPVGARPAGPAAPATGPAASAPSTAPSSAAGRSAPATDLDAAIGRLTDRLRAAEREIAGIATELAALHDIRRQVDRAEARHERARQELTRFRNEVERAARTLLDRVDGLFAEDRSPNGGAGDGARPGATVAAGAATPTLGAATHQA